jgi:hypothetical protein
MCEVAQRYVPDVRMTASPALMRRWYKGADTVRDDGGVLRPWAPSPKVPAIAAPVDYRGVRAEGSSWGDRIDPAHDVGSAALQDRESPPLAEDLEDGANLNRD